MIIARMTEQPLPITDKDIRKYLSIIGGTSACKVAQLTTLSKPPNPTLMLSAEYLQAVSIKIMSCSQSPLSDC